MNAARNAAVLWLIAAVPRAACLGRQGPDTAPAPSRAAWWLARDGVEAIADLVNAAGGGKRGGGASRPSRPRFRDRLGRFRAEADGRALVVSGNFPKAGVWRFDLTTFDGGFDMRRLYVEYGYCAHPDPHSIQTRRLARLLGDPKKALTHTGPWDIFNGRWEVPTARVALDGRHVYTLWFGLPSLADQAAGRVYASFALEIGAGEHAVRISFDDFARHTRWRATRRQPTRPEVTYVANPLRPHHVGSVAVGEDERVRWLEDVRLKPALRGRHPRLSGKVELPGGASGERLGPEDRQVRKLIDFLDPDRGELWEYSDDAESMASGNDMDAGRKGLAACAAYDRLLPRLTGEARSQVDRAFLKRFRGIYRFFVFQRNYLPTGYAQNHCSKAVWALVGAGLVWDGPEAAKWRRWAAMICRRRVALLARDGGLEWMNESRRYGLAFWQTARDHILRCTGVDLAAGPFFENEWRYALHNAPQFPTGADRVPLLIGQHGVSRDANRPLPPGVTAENTPTSHHFDDCDQVFLRSGWSERDWRVRFVAGSVFGKHGTPIAGRYNWAHCQVSRGSFAIARGTVPVVHEPGRDRTYRKGAANNNCILVNDCDQWGGGQVWHPRLRLDQVGRIAFFADGRLIAAARAELADAYPPRARLRSLWRVLVQLKPDHFLVFDRVALAGAGKAEWRFHAAFVEPQRSPGRFTLFGFRSAAKGRKRPASFEQAFERVADARLDAAVLLPHVPASADASAGKPAGAQRGMRVELAWSDVYYRWHGFRRPTRHLRVTQQGRQRLHLLTAFAPKLALTPRGRGAFAARRDGVSWVVLAGGGSAEGLASDAPLAVAAYDAATRTAEVARFGGTRLAFRGADVKTKGRDAFAVIRDGNVAARAGRAPARP